MVKTEKKQEMKISQAIYLMLAYNTLGMNKSYIRTKESIPIRRKCKEKDWSLSSYKVTLFEKNYN